MKKIGMAIGAAILLIAATTQLLHFIPLRPKEGPGYNCPFCRKSVLEKQSYYEGELVSVLVNISPVAPGHSLIIPKRHVARFDGLTEAEIAEMGQTIKKVQKAFAKVYGTEDFLLVLQNGPNGGQTVFHTHYHMIPREKQNNVAKLMIWVMMLKRGLYYWAPIDWTNVEKQRLALKEAI